MTRQLAILGFVISLGAAAACGGGSSSSTSSPLTYWQDAAPIFDAKCVKCHQAGGIGPFRLDDYVDAKAFASLEKVRVNQGTMPPYFMVHDGSCQTFQDDATLSDAEKATITAWVD